MDKNPITADRAEQIRARFLGFAEKSRQDAAEAEARGDHEAARLLIATAESQERMAQKRYEAMKIVRAF